MQYTFRQTEVNLFIYGLFGFYKLFVYRIFLFISKKWDDYKIRK